jgi:hypothetical protein
MFSRRISVGVLAGIVGMAMLMATSGSSTAFTLSSPSLEKPFVGAYVEQIWWDRWGHWHGGWHRWHGGWVGTATGACTGGIAGAGVGIAPLIGTMGTISPCATAG